MCGLDMDREGIFMPKMKTKLNFHPDKVQIQETYHHGGFVWSYVPKQEKPVLFQTKSHLWKPFPPDVVQDLLPWSERNSQIFKVTVLTKSLKEMIHTFVTKHHT